MRRILNINFLLAVLLVAVVLLLNYINFVPLYKILPFLPHVKQTKIDNQQIIPTPTPVPPFSVKKLDLPNKSGEFVIGNNPTPNPSSVSSEKQILIDGTYSVDNKKITIQVSAQDSSIPIHPMPQGLADSSAILLRLKMIVDNTVFYETDMPLTNSEKVNIIPFKIRLPFYSPAIIKIYIGANETFSQEVKL